MQPTYVVPIRCISSRLIKYAEVADVVCDTLQRHAGKTTTGSGCHRGVYYIQPCPAPAAVLCRRYDVNRGVPWGAGVWVYTDPKLK